MSQVIIRAVYSFVFWLENGFLQVKPRQISLLAQKALFTVTSIYVI